MQLNRRCRKYFGLDGTVKTVLSAFLALQLLFLLALAACPALHHALHSDSDNPGHECQVTAFIKGQLNDAAMAPVVAAAAVFVICAELLPAIRPRLSFEFRFSPSRAPPGF